MNKNAQIKTVHQYSKKKKSVYFITAIILLICTMYVSNTITESIQHRKVVLSFIGIILLSYMITKLLFSLAYSPYHGSEDYNLLLMQKKIDIVIPFYNEDLTVIKQQIASFQEQTFQNFQIHYIDDGSDNKDVFDYLQEMSQTYSKLTVIRTEQNCGKRHAQCLVFPHLTGDFIFTSDSDTTFHQDNLLTLLQPFEKEGVLAVTGHVRVLNDEETWLSKLLSIRYFNAFEAERAGQSALGSVLVCSGPNTLFRTEVIKKYLPEYENQVFLGKKQTYGDDRALTNFVLREGMALYQSNAQCFTEVPTHFKKFLKQQVRWSKSFFRESYFGLKNTWKYKKVIPFIWILIELALFPVFLASLMYIVYLIITGQFTKSNFIILLIFTIVNSYIRNLYYISINKRTFLIAPIYSFIHLFFLTPIRLWALFTLRDTKWGTREIHTKKEGSK